MAHIYSIKNIQNGKHYIGLTRQHNPIDRYKRHLKDARYSKEKQPIHFAINRYGEENFVFTILEECDDDKVEEREIHFIEKYNSYYKGYNATLGGNIRYDAEYKPVTQYDKQGNKLRDFPSITDATIAMNSDDKTRIGRCTKGQRFSAFGYRWSWKDETLADKIRHKCGYKVYIINKKTKERKVFDCSVDCAEFISGKRKTNMIKHSLNSPSSNKLQVKGWYCFRDENDMENFTPAVRYKLTSSRAKELGKMTKKRPLI